MDWDGFFSGNEMIGTTIIKCPGIRVSRSWGPEDNGDDDFWGFFYMLNVVKSSESKYLISLSLSAVA